MQQAYGDQVAIVGVGGRGDIAEMQTFVDTYGVGDFAHVTDEDGEVWETYGVFTQPTFAFIDDDGSFEVTQLGTGELAGRIDALLAS